DSNLICPICQSPFLKPLSLDCDHTFCKSCLRQSYKMNEERRQGRSCPTCRRPRGQVQHREAPRYVKTMLEELVVKCPNHETGCPVEVRRGEVQDHVDKYCDYQEVPCQGADCKGTIRRKDRDKECLHHGVKCENCDEEVQECDLELHLERDCRNNMTSCPHCSEAVSRRDLASHINETCGEAPAVCAGSRYGCHHSGKRSAVNVHSTHCPIATMTPFLETQKCVLEQQRAALDRLHRRNEILEGSVKAMQVLLYDAPSHSANHHHPTSMATSTTNPPPLDLSTSPHTAAAAAEDALSPPFDTPTQHLLSLHESLRDELSRLEGALSDLDARATMMILSESQRSKEETAHANAAINGMRAQLHWLMSARLQQAQAQRGRVGAGAGGDGSAGPSAGGGAGGAGGAGMANPRRLSGQETKL
ncbi:MAG: hypothetical protein INR71_10805, partial [Terriglobus roseus]|nr:hypothetical protein [Terriglobus roseus]